VPGTMYEEYWFSDISRLKTFEMMTYKLMDYKNLVREDDVNGVSVFMDSKFLMFRSWFEEKLTHTENQDIREYKSPGHVKIKTVEQIKKAAHHHIDDKEHAMQRFLYKADEIILSIKGYTRQLSDALKQTDIVLKRLTLKQDVARQLHMLDGIDKILTKDFVGKEFINIALQKIIHKINEGYELDFGYEVPQEQKPVITSRFLYNEMKEVSELNLKYLNELTKKLGN
jgi:hypothetical protein